MNKNKQQKKNKTERKNTFAVLDKFDVNWVSIFSFKKHAYADRIFTLILVSIKQSLKMQ